MTAVLCGYDAVYVVILQTAVIQNYGNYRRQLHQENVILNNTATGFPHDADGNNAPGGNDYDI